MRLLSVLVALAALASAVGVSADSGDREVYIFKGTPLAQSGISVGSWGSGKAVDSADSTRVLTGGRSIKITTQGLYSGGRIDFAQPVALFTEGIDSTRYIVFSFFFDAVDTIDPAAGSAYSYEIEPYKMPKARIVRFVFISDKGEMLAAEEPTNPLDPDVNWCRVAVPIAKFKALGDIKEFRLSRLLIFTDLATTLYLGEVKMVTDTEPIKVQPLSDQTIVVYVDEVMFLAEATGGVSSLQYSWDFDASNGIQQETTGKVGRYVYTRGGDFTVTLTVSDADNIKPPVTVTAKVSVTD